MNGVEDDPDDVPMRQIPSTQLPWSQTTWISEAGIVRNRYFDVVNRTWRWGNVRRPTIDDGNGRIGYYVYNRFRTIKQAIALAWIPRSTEMKRLQRVEFITGEAMIAHNLKWADEREDDDDMEESGDTNDDALETWMPLTAFKMGIISFDAAGFYISSFGRIKTPREISRGHCVFGQYRLFPLPTIGLVPLQALRDATFASQHTHINNPPPRIKTTMRLLRRSHSIHSISKKLAIKESTAWSYAHMALTYMSTQSAQKITTNLLRSSVIESVVRKLASETDVVLTGRLRDVMCLLNREFASDCSWRCNPFRYEQLRMIRTLLQREH